VGTLLQGRLPEFILMVAWTATLLRLVHMFKRITCLVLRYLIEVKNALLKDSHGTSLKLLLLRGSFLLTI
jgi:hypothetical protein